MTQEPKTLAEDNLRLLTDEFHCDVNFLVGPEDEKQTVRAHRIILASRSLVFSAMFFGELKETSADVTLPDTEGGVFKTFLKYVYTDSTDIEKENVYGLLYLATKYDVPTLLRACESFCVSIISLDELCTLMNISTKYNLQKLWIECMRFVLTNKIRVFPSEYLYELEIQTIEKFVSCEDLAVEENLIFEYLRSWAEKECSRKELDYTIENERSVLGSSLQHVRFPILDSSVFTETVAVTEILSTEEEIDIFRSICSSKVKSKRFPTNRRKTCQEVFDWTGAYLETDTHTFNANKPFVLKSLILQASSIQGNLHLRFTSAKNSDLGSLDSDYEYEIACPPNDHNSYFLVCLPDNGIHIQRQTNISLKTVEYFDSSKRGKIEISCIFTAIKNDERLKSVFCLDDTSTSLPIQSAQCGGFQFGQIQQHPIGFGATTPRPNLKKSSNNASVPSLEVPTIKACFFQL